MAEEEVVTQPTEQTEQTENIKPDYVHVLMNGKIAKSGCMELAEELEKAGYEKI